jgi:hypothetical protein
LRITHVIRKLVLGSESPTKYPDMGDER